MKLIELFVVFWILLQYISIQFSEKTHKKLLSLFTLYVTISLILLNEKREFFSFLTLSIFAGGIAILTFVWSTSETLNKSGNKKTITYFLTEKVLILGLAAIFILKYDTPELKETDGEEINLEEMFTNLFSEDNCAGILTLFVLSLLLLILLTTAKLKTTPKTKPRTAFDFTTDRALDMRFYRRTISTASFGSSILPALRFIAKFIVYIILIVPLFFKVLLWRQVMGKKLRKKPLFTEIKEFFSYPIPLRYGPRADFKTEPGYSAEKKEEKHLIFELKEYYNTVSMSQELHESASIMAEKATLFLENTYKKLPKGFLIICFIILSIYLLTSDICWEFMENWLKNLWDPTHWKLTEHKPPMEPKSSITPIEQKCKTMPAPRIGKCCRWCDLYYSKYFCENKP